MNVYTLFICIIKNTYNGTLPIRGPGEELRAHRKLGPGVFLVTKCIRVSFAASETLAES